MNALCECQRIATKMCECCGTVPLCETCYKWTVCKACTLRLDASTDESDKLQERLIALNEQA